MHLDSIRMAAFWRPELQSVGPLDPILPLANARYGVLQLEVRCGGRDSIFNDLPSRLIQGRPSCA